MLYLIDQWQDFAPKEIVNLVEDIRKLLVLSRESRIEYCNSVINTEADILVKMDHT